ncbi:MAG: hypothetical protein V4541_06845 [Bacteroidota bacterium]
MNTNDWPAIEVLEDYLDGKLDAKAMHRIEKISLEDPFVAQALAGLSESHQRVQSLSLLQKQLQERIALKPIEKKRWQITSQRLSIAAAAAVLFVAASVLFWMKDNRYRAQHSAQSTSKNVAVTVINNPVPLNGMDAYHIYLTTHNRLTKNETLGKEVILTFLIDKDGQPSAIKIVNGIGEAQNEEAIRLVKAGAKWVPLAGAKNEVLLNVKF